MKTMKTMEMKNDKYILITGITSTSDIETEKDFLFYLNAWFRQEDQNIDLAKKTYNTFFLPQTAKEKNVCFWLRNDMKDEDFSFLFKSMVNCFFKPNEWKLACESIDILLLRDIGDVELPEVFSSVLEDAGLRQKEEKRISSIKKYRKDTCLLVLHANEKDADDNLILHVHRLYKIKNPA